MQTPREHGSLPAGLWILQLGCVLKHGFDGFMLCLQELLAACHSMDRVVLAY
jgi:hypothetical protein